MHNDKYMASAPNDSL